MAGMSPDSGSAFSGGGSNAAFKKPLLWILVFLVFEQSYAQNSVESKPFSFNLRTDSSLS